MVNTISNADLVAQTYEKAKIKDTYDAFTSLEPFTTVVDFPEGTTRNIPNVGQLPIVTSVAQGAVIPTQDLITGNETFTLDYSYDMGFSVTDEFKDDSGWVNLVLAHAMQQMVSQPLAQRSSDIAHLQSGQTGDNPNVVSGADHRFVSTVTNNVGHPNDVALAQFIAKKSRLPSGITGIISTEQALYWRQLAATGNNFFDQHNFGANNMYRDAAVGGSGGAMNYVGRVFGTDVYESTDLDIVATESIAATAGTPLAGTRGVTAGHANLWLGPEAIISHIRTDGAPEYKRIQERKMDAWFLRIRYALKRYRRESFIVQLTDDV